MWCMRLLGSTRHAGADSTSPPTLRFSTALFMQPPSLPASRLQAKDACGEWRDVVVGAGEVVVVVGRTMRHVTAGVLAPTVFRVVGLALPGLCLSMQDARRGRRYQEAGGQKLMGAALGSTCSLTFMGTQAPCVLPCMHAAAATRRRLAHGMHVYRRAALCGANAWHPVAPGVQAGNPYGGVGGGRPRRALHFQLLPRPGSLLDFHKQLQEAGHAVPPQ